MKYLHTFESFLNERISSFKGKKVNDLYKIIKNDPDVMIFANGKHYSISDIDELRNDLQNEIVYLLDMDGEESEIKISDIDFIDF